MKKSQEETRQGKLARKIKGIQEKIQELSEMKSTTSRRRKLFKLNKSLNDNLKRVGKDIVFGGRKLLQELSKKDENYLVNKEAYTNLRNMYVFSVGDADKKGNRKFKLDMENNKIHYRQNRKTHIEIEISPSKKWTEELSKIQQLMDDRKIPVTFKLTEDYVWVTYDESYLNGYQLDKKLLVKGDKIHNRKIFQELENLKMVGKIRHRFCGVDLNPEYIGFSICDKLANGKIKQVYKECVDLSWFSDKLGLSSDDKLQNYQNNKRKHEICESWKYIFEKCMHYKVGNFVVEQLNFEEGKDLGKSANRKIKNLWLRTLTSNLITKYCNILGLTRVDINPCYTSFIGNIQHRDFDPVNASLEICRRGMYKYEKGGFYPDVSKKDIVAMSRLIDPDLLRDDGDQNVEADWEDILPTTWAEWFQIFRKTKSRYRRLLEDVESFGRSRLKSIKSKTLLYNFLPEIV